MGNYGSLNDHATAMLDLLYAVPNLTVYPAQGGGPSTVPPGTVPPYVSVHFSADHTKAGQRMTHKSTRFRMRAYAHCVGQNDILARALADLVQGAWLDVKPDIDGRSVYPIEQEPSREPQVDEPVAQTTVTITAVYRLETESGRP